VTEVAFASEDWCDVTKPQNPEDVSQFLAHVKQVRDKWLYPYDDPYGPWFRGQTRSYWKLQPRLFRDYGTHPTHSISEIEDEVREEFVVRAPIFSDTKPAGEDDWEWYFLMQHYGAPTRLLDWTEGALLGLYFAVKDNPGHYDAAVWMLDPYELNWRVIRKEEVIPPSAPNLTKSYKRLVRPWLPSRFLKHPNLPPRPVAVFPTHITRRISTQRSCFTIQGRDPDGLIKFQEGQRPCLVKIVIPSFRVRAVQRELEACGIDEATIFPDMDGLGRSLSSKWREDRHRLPHEGVYVRLRPNGRGSDSIGVFAIRKIKKDAPVFTGENEEVLWLEKDTIPPRVSREIRRLYNEFALTKDGRYGCPPNFNRLTPAWYLRQAKVGENPNLRWSTDGYAFFALRDIHPGEELTVNFN
jgi:FRG domain